MSDSLIGNLLVASSLVNDPVMGQSVCLVVHQDEEQSIGVMLNRPIHPNPQALLKMLTPPSQQHVSGPSSDDSLPNDNSANTNRMAAAQNHSTNTNDEGYGSESESNVDARSDDEQVEQTLAKATAALGIVHFGGPMNGPVVAIHGSSEFAEAETGSGIYVAAQKPNLEGLVRRQEAPYRLIVGHIGWNHQQLLDEVNAGIWHVVPATTDAVFGLDQDMWPKLIRRATARSVANWIGTPDVPMAYEVN